MDEEFWESDEWTDEDFEWDFAQWKAELAQEPNSLAPWVATRGPLLPPGLERLAFTGRAPARRPSAVAPLLSRHIPAFTRKVWAWASGASGQPGGGQRLDASSGGAESAERLGSPDDAKGRVKPPILLNRITHLELGHIELLNALFIALIGMMSGMLFMSNKAILPVIIGVFVVLIRMAKKCHD